jgi:hypothetical protein
MSQVVSQNRKAREVFLSAPWRIAKIAESAKIAEIENQTLPRINGNQRGRALARAG